MWRILKHHDVDPAPQRTSVTWTQFLRSQAGPFDFCSDVAYCSLRAVGELLQLQWGRDVYCGYGTRVRSAVSSASLEPSQREHDTAVCGCGCDGGVGGCGWAGDGCGPRRGL